MQYSSARCSLLSCFFSHTWSCHAPCQSTARFLPALSAPNSSSESFYTPSRYRTGLLTITDKLKCRAPAEGAVWELRKKKKGLAGTKIPSSAKDEDFMLKIPFFQHIPVITLKHQDRKQGAAKFQRAGKKCLPSCSKRSSFSLG